MGPRRLLPAILLLLLPGPALLAGDDRVVKVEVSLAGRGGRSLAPLVIHLAPWQAEHAKVEEEVERFLALEARALGGLIEHDASVFGLDSIVSLDITWTPRGQLYDQYRDLAGRLDERLGRLRTIEGEYFAAVANLLPDGPPAVLADGRRIDRMDAPLRDRVIAALRQRLADAFAAREAAVDSHLEATVRAESSGVPGNATLARGIQGTLALEAGGHLLSEIEAKEKERISLVAAIEQTERDLEKKSKEAVELGQAPPADPAEHERKLRALSDDIASLRAKLDGRPAGPDGAAGEKGQKPRLRETEGAISELRQRYAEARQRRLAEAAVGGEGGAATGNAMARISSHYVELEHARRTMARTTADLEILAESLTTIGAGRVERAIAARRLAVADPDVAERILHDRDLPAREVIMSSGAELREAAIDTGIASLLRRGAGTEDALLAQNEYLHGLSTLLGKKQLAAGSGGTRALQWVSNLGRGVLDLGFGAWDGFLDNTKQVVNRASPYPFRTKTARTRDSLADERKKTRDKIQILEQARGRDGPALFSGFDLSPDEPFDLGGDSVRRGAGAKAAPLDLLKRDRAFFDATNGGLRRIACSFDVTLFERLRSEYLVACERAALTLEGLERAQARHHNMDEDTRRFSPKAILSPGRVAETLCYIYLSRGKADDLNSHVALRTEQLGVMKGLLPLWKRLDFDVLGLTRWEHFGEYRQTIRNHAELLRHPDYARFWEVAGAEREAAQEDLSRVLAEEAARTNTVDRRDHAARERVRQAIPRTAGLLAGALVEDAKDLGFQDDFAGCYAALARANAMDWSVVSTETLRRVEDELAWLEASDLATTSLIQVADQAFYAALSARMFPPGPQTPLGTLVRHPSLIYKAAKATIGTWKGLSGLAGFAVQQVNPLSMILNWNTLVRGELAVGLVSLARATSEALTREALRDGVFCRVMDPEWADALANILVDAAFFKAQQSLQDHFVTKWANELKDAERQLERTRRYQDIAEHTEVEYIRRQARAEMMSAVELSALEARVRQVRGRLQFFQGAGLVTDEKRAERLLHQAARAEHQVQAIRHPTTARRVDNVLTALAWGLDSDDPEVARKARVELFRRLDVDEVARIRSRLDMFRRADGSDPELARRVDNVRRAIVEDACNEFLRIMRHDPLKEVDDPDLLKRLAALRPEQISALSASIMGLVYTGSGGRPRGREYKPLISDLDLTLLVTDLDVPMRNLLKDLLDYSFVRVTTVRYVGEAEAPKSPWLWGDRNEPKFPGFRPDHFELNFMVDCADLLFPKGFKATGPEGFVAGLKAEWDAHVARTGDDSPESFRRFHEDLAKQLEQDIATLENNILDPEKYVIAGRLRALSYLTGISGVLQVPDAQTMRFVLAEDADPGLARYARDLAEQTLHRARLEKWMALDIMLDDMRFLHKTVKKYGPPSRMEVDDLFAFMDKLDKYSIRVLMGALAGQEEGLARLNGLLTRPGGGDHGDLCDIALALAREGKLNLTEGEQLLIREWRQRKLGGRMHEILGERIGRMDCGPDDPVFHRALAEHVEGSLDLVRKLMVSGLDSGCAEVSKLDAAIVEARGQPGGEAKARVLELQRDKILMSWAAAWEKLPESERTFAAESFRKAGLDVERFVKEQKAVAADIRGGGHFVPGKMTFYQQYLEDRARREREERDRRKEKDR